MLTGKLLLIDYVGQSDDRGQPVGHSVKTLKEALDLLDGTIQCELVIPRNYGPEFPIDKKQVTHYLNYHSSINIKKVYNRMFGVWRKLSNLKKVFKNFKEEVLWFVHPDFLLFVFLFFYFFKIRNKILITMYMEGYNLGNTAREKIKHFFFKRTISRVDLVVKNSDKIKVSENEIFCPDYLYKEDRYKPFPKVVSKKQEHVLGTGVMNRAKDVLNLVKVWRRSDINFKLKVSGFFPDKKLFEEVKEYAGDRIEITDCYPSSDEYYTKIAESKFVILSYKKSKYTKRTSGILLESIYLDTPVIAPAFLLDYTGLPGIGYDSLEDIERILAGLDERKLAEIKKEMAQVRNEYRFGTMKKKISAALECLAVG